MNNINIKTIPHSDQLYDTAGDYYWKNGNIQVMVSDMHDADYEFAILIHELVEIHLCLRDGVTLEASTEFDVEWLKGKHKKGDEPGDDPKCPYYKQHQMATVIEKKLIKLLGRSWKEYVELAENLAWLSKL